jgi:thiosulfate/3-mercaptopyruvate sulfurtransferase
LHALLGAPDVCILDCRHDLGHPELGQQQFAQAHIAGAVFAHLDHDLAGPRTGTSGRHPLPAPTALARRLRDWGVGASTLVVAYDASESAYAARAWWLLRWLGHARVAVLDGGWPAWLAAGYRLGRAADGPGRGPAPGDFVPGASLQPTASLDSVIDLVRNPGARGALLIDARAPDRYAGHNETLDPVGGHIPGAINRFWKHNLGSDGRFKDAAQLRAEYDALLAGRPPGQVTVQCGSGVTACHDLLALHLAGLPGAALFPGSWSQWVADPSRPVATGPDP